MFYFTRVQSDSSGESEPMYLAKDLLELWIWVELKIVVLNKQLYTDVIDSLKPQSIWSHGYVCNHYN